MKNHDSKASYYKWVDIDHIEDANLLPSELKNIGNSQSFEHIIVNDLKDKEKHV